MFPLRQRPKESPLTQLYCDGGVMSVNPSPYGGTWAWCLVDANDKRLQCNSGILLPGDVGMQAISNNVAELFAALQALQAMPPRWDGFLRSDSQITIYRLQGSTSFNGLPQSLVDQLLQIRRGRLWTPLLVGGHPTRKDLEVGYDRRGLPVSRHNQWCDKECNRQAKRFLEKQRVPEGPDNAFGKQQPAEENRQGG